MQGHKSVINCMNYFQGCRPDPNFRGLSQGSKIRCLPFSTEEQLPDLLDYQSGNVAEDGTCSYWLKKYIHFSDVFFFLLRTEM